MDLPSRSIESSNLVDNFQKKPSTTDLIKSTSTASSSSSIAPNSDDSDVSFYPSVYSKNESPTAFDTTESQSSKDEDTNDTSTAIEQFDIKDSLKYDKSLDSSSSLLPDSIQDIKPFTVSDQSPISNSTDQSSYAKRNESSNNGSEIKDDNNMSHQFLVDNEEGDHVEKNQIRQQSNHSIIENDIAPITNPFIVSSVLLPLPSLSLQQMNIDDDEVGNKTEINVQKMHPHFIKSSNVDTSILLKDSSNETPQIITTKLAQDPLATKENFTLSSTNNFHSAPLAINIRDTVIPRKDLKPKPTIKSLVYPVSSFVTPSTSSAALPSLASKKVHISLPPPLPPVENRGRLHRNGQDLSSNRTKSLIYSPSTITDSVLMLSTAGPIDAQSLPAPLPDFKSILDLNKFSDNEDKTDFTSKSELSVTVGISNENSFSRHNTLRTVSSSNHESKRNSRTSVVYDPLVFATLMLNPSNSKRASDEREDELIEPDHLINDLATDTVRQVLNRQTMIWSHPSRESLCNVPQSINAVNRPVSSVTTGTATTLATQQSTSDSDPALARRMGGMIMIAVKPNIPHHHQQTEKKSMPDQLSFKEGDELYVSTCDEKQFCDEFWQGRNRSTVSNTNIWSIIYTFILITFVFYNLVSEISLY